MRKEKRQKIKNTCLIRIYSKKDVPIFSFHGGNLQQIFQLSQLLDLMLPTNPTTRSSLLRQAHDIRVALIGEQQPKLLSCVH